MENIEVSSLPPLVLVRQISDYTYRQSYYMLNVLFGGKENIPPGLIVLVRLDKFKGNIHYVLKTTDSNYTIETHCHDEGSMIEFDLDTYEKTIEEFVHEYTIKYTTDFIHKWYRLGKC